MSYKKKFNSYTYFFIYFTMVLLLAGCTPSNTQAYPEPIKQTIESDLYKYEDLLSQKDLTIQERLRVESLLTESQEVATMVSAPTPSKEQIANDIAEYESKLTMEEIQPTPTPELGILESGIFFEAHVPRRVKIENIWQGYVNGNLTRVYAGQLQPDYRTSTSVAKEEPQLGAIYTMTFLSDGTVETNLQSTDKETGALRIQEVNKDFLVLGSMGTKGLTSQRLYYYNLGTHELANSLDDLYVAPTTPKLDSYP